MKMKCFLSQWILKHVLHVCSVLAGCLLHNCYTFGMDSTLVGVSKKANQIGFTCLLQSTNSCTLEAQVCFEVLSDFSHQTLERKFVNQKFSGLLITSNFIKCHSTRPVTMRFLHPSSSGRTLVSGFGSQLLPWCFTTGAFVGYLLCTNHGIATSLLILHLRLELGELEEALALESDSGCEHLTS